MYHREEGSATGRLGMISVNHTECRFAIFPVIGKRKILGSFSLHKKEFFKAGFDQMVTVHGSVLYKFGVSEPCFIKALDIEVHPTTADLPTLKDLKGIAPNATGSMTSVEFIENLRANHW